MGKGKTKAVTTVSGSPAAPVRCKEHKTYNAITAPRKTTKHPKGCTTCWAYYTALREAKEDYEHLHLKAASTTGGRGLKCFGSPRDLAEMGLWYLEWCIRNEKYPTKSGFAVYCGVSIDTLRTYRVGEYDVDKSGVEHNPSFSVVVKKLDSVFIAKQEQRLLDARAAATNLIAWMNNNAGWSQQGVQKMELGIEIRTVDFSGGTKFVKEPCNIIDIEPSRAGDPPDAGTAEASDSADLARTE